MSNVTRLRNASEEPDEDVVGVLETALEKARAGELRTVAVVGDLTGNQTYTNFATHDMQAMIGMLAFLQFSLSAKLYGNTVEDDA